MNRTPTFKQQPVERRKGLIKIAERLQAEDPRRSWEECLTLAKIEWTARNR